MGGRTHAGDRFAGTLRASAWGSALASVQGSSSRWPTASPRRSSSRAKMPGGAESGQTQRCAGLGRRVRGATLAPESAGDGAAAPAVARGGRDPAFQGTRGVDGAPPGPHDHPSVAPQSVMSTPFRVALLGFSAFERSAMASYFRLAHHRDPAYEQGESLADSRFVVADADHADAVQAVIAGGRMHETVFIGGSAPAGAAAWMMRPIDPLHVLRELDSMVALRAPAPAPAPRTAARPPPRPSPARRASDTEEPAGFIGVAGPGIATGEIAPRRERRALLVDDSEIALRFLETRLEPFGFACDRATTSAKAIELLAQRVYDFAFIDVDLGPASELDGLELCQHLKRRSAAGPQAPVVAMVSAHAAELDRARGLLAGADAYLGKPLAGQALGRLLNQHGVELPATRAAGGQ